jgi:hypothetical protein
MQATSDICIAKDGCKLAAYSSRPFDPRKRKSEDSNL